MTLRQLFELSRAVMIPLALGLCLLCGVIAAFVIVTTPEGLDPVDGLVLRAYLTSNNEELNTPFGTDPTQKRIEVPPGASASDIGIILVEEAVIGNGTLFARYAQYEGLDQDLRPGIFYVSQTQTIPQILDVLTDPLPSQIRITVRENMRLEEIADIIDNTERLGFTGDEFIAIVSGNVPLSTDFRQRYGIPETSSLEGFLFPETYLLDVNTTAVDFRDLMLRQFDQSITPEMITTVAQDPQWSSMYDVVKVASIVEREAVLEDERPIIASVFINRLNNPTEYPRLQADPTVQYQTANNLFDASSPNFEWWPFLNTVLSRNNCPNLATCPIMQGPYNTYQNAGLPPTPIVSPSISSIRSVIFSADTPYYFFRATCEQDGRHQFAETFDQHNANAC